MPIDAAVKRIKQKMSCLIKKNQDSDEVQDECRAPERKPSPAERIPAELWALIAEQVVEGASYSTENTIRNVLQLAQVCTLTRAAAQATLFNRIVSQKGLLAPIHLGVEPFHSTRKCESAAVIVSARFLDDALSQAVETITKCPHL